MDSSRTGRRVSADMKSGLIDRFRCSPISRCSVVAARVLSDLSRSRGRRPRSDDSRGRRGIHNRLADALAACRRVAPHCVRCDLGWVCAGVFLANLGALQAVDDIVFSPLCVVSNAFVPTQGGAG